MKIGAETPLPVANIEKENKPMTPEKLEAYFGKLKGLTGAMAKEVNKETGKKILDQDGCIKMSMWQENNGGIFTKEQVRDDLEHIENKKIMWSNADNENTKKFYKENYGIETKEELVKKYEENRDKSKPALLESATTILFHKILKDKFLVMKSAEYDDYENGADNVIVDKETGNIVCAFDEVHGEVTGKEKDRGEKKDKKIKIMEKARRGGVEIKYGLTFEKNEETGERKMTRKSFNNIPAFYLSLKPQELGSLLDGIDGDLGEKVSAEGLKIFDNFIASLEEQIGYLQSEEMPKKVSNNINSFKKSLETIKNERVKYEG